jgi:hypothetical protein
MADLKIPFLKLLTAKPFQKRPRPNVTVGKLHTAMGRMGNEVELEDLLATLQRMKGQGFANTIPKILLPDELASAQFQIWITPLGRDALHSALSS